MDRAGVVCCAPAGAVFIRRYAFRLRFGCGCCDRFGVRFGSGCGCWRVRPWGGYDPAGGGRVRWKNTAKYKRPLFRSLSINHHNQLTFYPKSHQHIRVVSVILHHFTITSRRKRLTFQSLDPAARINKSLQNPLLEISNLKIFRQNGHFQ